MVVLHSRFLTKGVAQKGSTLNKIPRSHIDSSTPENARQDAKGRIHGGNTSSERSRANCSSGISPRCISNFLPAGLATCEVDDIRLRIAWFPSG
jgi:hypothetical protein